MIEMSDAEFIERIKTRLAKNGWQRGQIGLPEGPNCLLGAAGYIAHDDLIVDKGGINPLGVDGRIFGEDESNDYENVPGMVRLAVLMGCNEPIEVALANDKANSCEQVIEMMERRVNGV